MRLNTGYYPGYYPEKNWKSRVCTNIFDREGKVQIVKGKLEVKCD